MTKCSSHFFIFNIYRYIVLILFLIIIRFPTSNNNSLSFLFITHTVANLNKPSCVVSLNALQDWINQSWIDIFQFCIVITLKVCNQRGYLLKHLLRVIVIFGKLVSHQLWYNRLIWNILNRPFLDFIFFNCVNFRLILLNKLSDSIESIWKFLLY